MYSPRTVLLVLTLGSAALIGWLCYPARADVGRGLTGQDGDRAVIHRATHHSSGRHSFPGRQRTVPDPTPDDWVEECSILPDVDDEGFDWAVIAYAVDATTGFLVESPAPSRIEPARSDHLLQVNHRFRC